MLPRSRTRTSPPSIRISACRRDAAGSDSFRSASESRPISSTPLGGSGRGYDDCASTTTRWGPGGLAGCSAGTVPSNESAGPRGRTDISGMLAPGQSETGATPTIGGSARPDVPALPYLITPAGICAHRSTGKPRLGAAGAAVVSSMDSTNAASWRSWVASGRKFSPNARR